jgi:hypothetical protein
MRQLAITTLALQCAVACGGITEAGSTRAGGGEPVEPRPSAAVRSAAVQPTAVPSTAVQPTTVPLTGATSTATIGSEAPTQVELVDDVDHSDTTRGAVPEDSSAFIWSRGIGNWFVSTDDGSVRDAKSDVATSERSVNNRAYHAGKTQPGAVVDLWAQLDHPSGRSIDLSGYSGFAFWARVDGNSGQLSVALSRNGHVTSANPSLPSMSGPLFDVSSEWQQFTIVFSDFDGSAVSSIDFVLGPSEAAFDLWIDDLALACRGSCP